jgi:3-keto-disaccharide hydrolase
MAWQRLSAIASLFVLVTSSAPANDGWTVLFDGGSTAAWRGYNRVSFPTGCWVVEDGALKTVPSKTPDACDLVTRRKYRDFELALEWKLGKGGNSGILYRAAELPPPAPIWHSAPELQILDDGAHPAATPQTLAGSLYDLIAPVDKVLRPPGEWNEARVVARGGHVEHWLNGRKVLEYELGSDALRARIAASKFKDMEHFAREKEGHVGLQHHGEEAWFRNIRIRTLRR